eukprot:m.414119 g.414119  ORF g.414119 m.414119 type:complete len:364 (-) comp56589_c0_seq4:173-1264(-)
MALFSFESEPDDWLQPFVPRSLVLSPLSSDHDSESSNPSVQITDPFLSGDFLASQPLVRNGPAAPQRCFVQVQAQYPPSLNPHTRRPPTIISPDQRKLLMDNGFNVPEDGELSSSVEVDLRKARRKLKNKLSAKDCRQRRKAYVGDLESQASTLQEQMHQLRTENKSLNERVSALQNLLLASGAVPGRIPVSLPHSGSGAVSSTPSVPCIPASSSAPASSDKSSKACVLMMMMLLCTAAPHQANLMNGTGVESLEVLAEQVRSRVPSLDGFAAKRVPLSIPDESLVKGLFEKSSTFSSLPIAEPLSQLQVTSLLFEKPASSETKLETLTTPALQVVPPVRLQPRAVADDALHLAGTAAHRGPE